MRSAAIGLLLMLAGCAQEPPAETVKPSVVRVTSSDFCEIMKGILPPTGKPRWSVKNDPITITDARKIGAAVDKKCASRPANQTQKE